MHKFKPRTGPAGGKKKGFLNTEIAKLSEAVLETRGVMTEMQVGLNRRLETGARSMLRAA